MTPINNVIDNVIKGIKNNVIDNDNDKYKKARNVEIIADKLLSKLDGKAESRPFMLKAAWRLSEHRLWDNLEQASKGNNPMGLFIYLCKRDGV